MPWLLQVGTRQSKICNFQHSFIVHQQITRFNVAVDNLIVMQRIEAFKQLFHEALDRFHPKHRVVAQIHQSGQIML